MEASEKRPISRNKKSVAKSRWKLIYNALKKESTDKCYSDNQDVSVWRFKSFGILQQRVMPDIDPNQDAVWSQFLCKEMPGYSLDIRELKVKPSAEDLIGFNNTGNVCIWPAEEVLTYYCLKNRSMFGSKEVCELGGGMTCLAGFTVAQASTASTVLVTDGNRTSCQNAEMIADKNNHHFGTTRVFVRQLLWNDKESFEDLKDKFDIVIGADCFFFDEYRQDLADTISSILKPGGMALMFAPHRGSTLKQFGEIAQKQFKTNILDNYDQEVWARHLELKSGDGDGNRLYDENIHYPLLLKLEKR